MMANHKNGTIYTGITSNLVKRIYEHKNAVKSGFASRYSCKKLVYYELFGDMSMAIEKERQLKSGNRLKKITLIETINPEWEDLYGGIIG